MSTKSVSLLCTVLLTGRGSSQHQGYQILAAPITLVSIQWSEHHYISFKWHGPVKLEGIFTEPSRLVSQQSTRTRAPACPRQRAESPLRRRWWGLHFWESTVLNTEMQRVQTSCNSSVSKILYTAKCCYLFFTVGFQSESQLDSKVISTTKHRGASQR